MNKLTAVKKNVHTVARPVEILNNSNYDIFNIVACHTVDKVSISIAIQIKNNLYRNIKMIT